MSDLFNELPGPRSGETEEKSGGPDDNQELTAISELSKKGYKYLRENRIEEAVDCFSQILKVDENNNYALVGMGDATRKRGSFKDAVIYYQHCLSYHPGNNYALFGLADCFKAINQFHKAIEIWEQYLLHDDKSITVLTRVADAYRKVRDFKHSKAVYLRVLEIEADNPYAIIGLGYLHYDFKEYLDALFYWEKMIEVNKDNVDIRVLTSIGNCHRKLKTFESGIAYFEKALQRDPGNFYALFGLADCYRGLNQQDRSLGYWNRILEQDPRNKVILTRAGDAYRNINQYEKSVDYYERALNIEFDTYAVLGLALVAKSQGKFDEAQESLRRLIQQDPKNYRLYIELADCRLRKGDRHEAVEILENFQRQGLRNNAVIEFLERIRY
ncbi:tetratricopeptide repeat protein [Leadbettera azotonutricia]|uniref:Tetratricopeptide repeat protein n=1 Tax=Leadbettera azotonutricia (strain ATCC BAA-888 / DSM 13862 / ZAS-9) TaxID=545695 RepID=F5YAZ3_LEAAZ|nr:tetratricopeptide repeat protein [Leadbettera azotonutricia]AEF83368.1 tetratricopeptide repeat protein [Leadbettera azotonutricia ZAS-9]